MTQVVDNSDPTRKRPRIRTEFPEESRTVQSDRDRADMKTILQRHALQGAPVNLARPDLEFRDVTSFSDYGDALRELKNAEAAFMRLPSKVREVFGHDPAEWLDAAEDGLSAEQRARLVEFGVLEDVEDPAKANQPARDPETGQFIEQEAEASGEAS